MTTCAKGILVPGTLLAASLSVSGCHRSTFPQYPASYHEFAYVANAASDTVTVLDLVYLRPDRTLMVGHHPSLVLANPARPEVYVINQGSGSVSVIDTASNVVAATVPVHREPAGASVDPTGHRLFVANTEASSVSVIDLDARRTVFTVTTPQHPTSALVSPDGRTVLVTLPTLGAVALYSATPVPSAKQAGKSGESPASLSLRNIFYGCPGATSPVFLPDSTKAFLACPGRNQVLSLAIAAAPDSWLARQSASASADHAVALLDVGPNPTSLTLKPDGGEIFVSNATAGSISEISTTTNEVGTTFPIGDLPAHGVISADNATLWISDEGADAVSLYSIDDGKLISAIHTGNAPDALAFSADQHLLLAADTRSGDVALIRTASQLGPGLFTLLPAGSDPVSIAIKATPLEH